MKLVYDVAHNIAKVEKHKINGEQKNLVVNECHEYKIRKWKKNDDCSK